MENRMTCCNCEKMEKKTDARVSTDVVIRVWDDREGAFLEIGPGEEGLGLEIRTTDKTSKEWFGDIRLLLNCRELAEQLGNAILRAAQDMRS